MKNIKVEWHDAEMDDDPIHYMDLKEFLDLGYLQEVNRLFFHPRGLALEMRDLESGEWILSGVWDYRDDPEGIIFVNDPDVDKIERVEAERQKHLKARVNLMGREIQQ